MKIYVYDEETMEVIAIAHGETNDECEEKIQPYINDYAATYSPAFGSIDGLKNPNEDIGIL